MMQHVARVAKKSRGRQLRSSPLCCTSSRSRQQQQQQQQQQLRWRSIIGALGSSRHHARHDHHPRVQQQQQQRRGFSSSTSSSSSSSSPWSISSILQMFKNIWQGEDHVNPKLILERKYLYITLLATKYRELRLLQHQQQSLGTVKQQQQQQVFDLAVQTLDAAGLDQQTNVQLRQAMQMALEPQVESIFNVFHAVDQEFLPLSSPNEENDHQNDFATMDWGPYQRILQKEYETVQQQQQKDTDRNQATFFERKRSALELLLEFHASSGTMVPPRTRNNDDMNNADSHWDAFGTNLNAIQDSDALKRIRYYQTLNLCRSAQIRQVLGYSVITLQSGLPGAGRGVYVDGTAWAGSLVAFQPGEVWPKEHLLTEDPEIMAHFDDGDDEDCQISLRFDDYVIDTRTSPVTILTAEGSYNPWAVGHVVNHPAAKTLPNCQSTILNYTERLLQKNKNATTTFAKYIPNYYARPPGWQSRFFYPEPGIVMHGLCLVARRDVQNEELVYDYRLQSHQTPAWYSVVQYDDDHHLDQEQVVFFRDDWMANKPRVK